MWGGGSGWVGRILCSPFFPLLVCRRLPNSPSTPQIMYTCIVHPRDRRARERGPRRRFKLTSSFHTHFRSFVPFSPLPVVAGKLLIRRHQYRIYYIPLRYVSCILRKPRGVAHYDRSLV